MPKVLYLVTEDWFFVSHFLPMGRAARDAGFDVIVATNVRKNAERIVAEGFRVIPLKGSRKSLGPLTMLSEIVQAYRIMRAERPDIVHCIALRTVVLGGLAARMAGVPGLLLAPTGLGYFWICHGPLAVVARSIIRFVVGSWLRLPQTRYLFENSEDPAEFHLDPTGPRVTVVGGAGVDPADFPVTPAPPAPPVKVAVVSRMIWPKGIDDAVEATRRARAQGAPVELHLFGSSDPGQLHPISDDVLRQWSAEPGIHWHGFVADVPGIWRSHHVALFLSRYREGVPRSLIESAASGRPIVTTDTIGCRDVVRNGQEGFVVPLGDIDAAAQALVKLASDPALRARFGAAAHARFNERFTAAAVQRTVGDLYRAMIRAE